MGHDVIVLGVGGVGSAALHHLAARGLDVLGIDRFAPGHARGSSHGHTRVIRKAYFEHPDYVPLLERAYTLWDQLSARVDHELFVRTGLVEIGPADGIVVPGVRTAAAEHDLDVDELDAADVARLAPGLTVPEWADVLFERDAGYLLVEDAVRAHARTAVGMGARLWTDVEVTGWATTSSGVHLSTTRGEVEADRLVVTAGAWAGRLLGDLDVALVPIRKQLHWYANASGAHRQDAGAPVFFYEVPEGMFYGFPSLDERGVKVAEHTGEWNRVADPLTLDRANDTDAQATTDAFVDRWLDGVSAPSTEHAVCMYTMSPDEHFVIDHHPADDRVVLCAGLSGHGFKFASALGELVADLAVNGSSDLPHGFLGLDRLTTVG